MRTWCAWLVVGTSAFAPACGDNVVPRAGVPLAHSDVLVLAAHEDDDMIFMQPELVRRLTDGTSLTTIYASTAGPKGRGPGIREAAQVAYGQLAGSQDWDCGELALGPITVEHCRLRDRPISIVDMGLADGAIDGDRTNSFLHLFEGSIQRLPAATAGGVTRESAVELFATVLDETTPTAIDTLDLAATHGRDNSSHMFVASIGLWAAARTGYSGPLTWHRGYNVEVETPTLDGADLASALSMLGYYEACADHCAACGTACPMVNAAHATWIARQYSTERVREARGKLVLDGMCLDATLALGDCAAAPIVELEPSGALRIGDACVATSATGELSFVACAAGPEQYWVLDSEGMLWSGVPPEPAANMAYDHVRCLTAQGTQTCGAGLQPHWTFEP